MPLNQLDQLIDEWFRKFPELKAVVADFIGSVKATLKILVEQVLLAAEFIAPEVFIVLKGIEFVFPSDISLVFEFKDAKGRTKRYQFTGSANKIDISIIEVISQMLSLVKWLVRLPKALEEFEHEFEAEAEKLNRSQQEIKAIKDAIRQTKLIATRAKGFFDAMTAPGSLTRKLVGDDVVDFCLKVVDRGRGRLHQRQPAASDFALCSFETVGLFDINSFAGVARTETRERIGTPTSILLDFAARKNQSLLGFQGHCLMERKVALGLTLGSFEIANGRLVPELVKE